jgi:hypothetical protein
MVQEPEGSSPHSQPATGPCPEPAESNPHPPSQTETLSHLTDMNNKIWCLMKLTTEGHQAWFGDLNVLLVEGRWKIKVTCYSFLSVGT